MDPWQLYCVHGVDVIKGTIVCECLQDADKENRGRSSQLQNSTRPFKSFSTERSPDIKRKRPDSLDASNQNAAAAAHKLRSQSASATRAPVQRQAEVNRNRAAPAHGKSMESLPTDGADLYETTNHVQRFRRTRAIFAQMEKQNQQPNASSSVSPVGRSRVGSRSVSPGRNRGLSPANSPRPYGHHDGGRQLSPSSPRSRSESASAAAQVFDYSLSATRNRSGNSRYETIPGKYRSGSVENLIQAPHEPPGYTSHAAYRSNELANKSSSAALKSRSETDLLRDYSDTEVFGGHVSSSQFDRGEPPPPSRTHSASSSAGASHITQHSMQQTSSAKPSHYGGDSVAATQSPTHDMFASKLQSSSASSAITSHDKLNASDGGRSSRQTTSGFMSSLYAKPYSSPTQNQTAGITSSASFRPSMTSSQPSHEVTTDISQSNSVNATSSSAVASSSRDSYQSTKSTAPKSAAPATGGYGRSSNYGRAGGRGAASPTSGAVDAHRRAREYIPKFKPDHDDDAEAMSRMDSIYSWRSRRNRDKASSQSENDDPMSSSQNSDVMSSSMTSTTSGALLPRRRARDDGISKEDIEASLHEADAYWSGEQNEGLPSAGGTGLLVDKFGRPTHLTDSVHSSGSGEEMARSDSNHDIVLDESPTSPIITSSVSKPQYNYANSPSFSSSLGNNQNTDRDSGDVSAPSWTSKYAIPSTKRNHSQGLNNNNQAINKTDANDVIESLGDAPSSPGIHRVDTLETELSHKPPLPSYPSSSVTKHVASQQHGYQRDRREQFESSGFENSMDDDDSGEIVLDGDNDVDYEVPAVRSPPPMAKPPPPFPESKSL